MELEAYYPDNLHPLWIRGLAQAVHLHLDEEDIIADVLLDTKQHKIIISYDIPLSSKQIFDLGGMVGMLLEGISTKPESQEIVLN